MMQEHIVRPAELPPGFFWLFEKGEKSPVVVEKKQGEDFVRFTNGRIERGASCVSKFVGPLQVPN